MTTILNAMGVPRPAWVTAVAHRVQVVRTTGTWRHELRHGEAGKRMTATILVADDEPFIVELLATVLEEEPYRVLRADEDAETLALATRARPDLVLAAGLMPRLAGRALASQVQAQLADAAPPIVLMSAMPLRAPPPMRFLSKPVDLAAVLALVASLVPTA